MTESKPAQTFVLVSHSWGGYPATGAAHRLAGRVAKVIYFGAVVPEPVELPHEIRGPLEQSLGR